jgi:hypothetical protein
MKSGNTIWVYFQMTHTNSGDIWYALLCLLEMLVSSVLLQTCRAPCPALGEPRHMDRKLTSSYEHASALGGIRLWRIAESNYLVRGGNILR